jgi:hypothetical protein
MAKQLAISINIQSKGAEKVIKNLSDLESELKILQGELKTLDFGTPAFKDAVRNINVLKSQIKDIDKATEGLETAQRVQAIGEAVGVVVSSFQILSGIIGLFITDQEDLEAVQKAETTALNILNVALGINTLLFQRAELAAKGYTLSTAASELATKAASKATAIWNAILALNPVVAVTAAIAGLAAGIYLLIDAFSEQNKVEAETIEIQNDLNAETLKAGLTLKEQLTILTDNVSTRTLELKTLEDLKKTYPGLNAFIDDNNRLTEEGIKFLKLQIALEELSARRKLILQKITDAEIKGAEDLNAELEFQNSKFGQAINFLAGLANGYGTAFTKAAALTTAIEDESREIGILNGFLDENTEQQEKILQQLEPLTKKTKAQVKADEDAAKAAKETTEVIDKQSVALALRLKLLTQIQEKLKQVQGAELVFTDDILQRQNEILQLQTELLGDRAEALNKNSEAVEEIARLFFQTIPSEEQVNKTTDAVFTLFNSVRSNLGGALVQGEVGFSRLIELVAQTGELTESQVELLRNLPKETQSSFVEFFNSYKFRITELQKLTRGIVGVEQLFGKTPQQIFDILREVENQQSELFESRIERGLTENQVLEKGRDLIKQQLGLNQTLFSLDVQIFDLKTRIAASDDKTAVVLNERLNLLLQEKTQITTIVDTILEGVVRNNKFVESINEANKAFEKNEAQILKNKKAIEQTFDPKQLEEYFREYGDGLDDVLKVLALDTGAFLQRFGEDGTKAIIKGVVGGLKAQGNITREEAENLVNIFENAAIGIKIAFGGVFEPFSDILKFLRAQLKQLPKELTPIQKEFMKIQEITQTILGAISDLSGRLQNVLQTNTSLLLEQLARDEELTLQRIGDANERARELRLAEEKKFAEQRFNIEKKARIQELNFAIANALVDSAGAIINALATIPPPLSVIYASSLAALTGAQVQAIRNQLTFVSSQQFVARQGGLISGNSHEMGGVPAMLEGGEFVVSRNAVSQFGDIIGELNSASGGRRLAIDDSRLVQAIADQNRTSTPLKAFVLYNDIQGTEKLNRKITQLARL